MTQRPIHLAYEVVLEPGEKLVLPAALVEQIGAGRWVITVTPAEPVPDRPVRDHSAFLRSYGPEDEGLYDDYPARRDLDR